jgi:hypothetical protein
LEEDLLHPSVLASPWRMTLEEPAHTPSSSLFWRRTLTAALCHAQVTPPWRRTLEEPMPTPSLLLF